MHNHLRRVGSTNFWEQVDSAWELARSADPRAFAAVLEILEEPARYHHEIINNIVDGLVKGAPSTLDKVLAYLKSSPVSPGGLKCALALGEIAYKQGNRRDPRIVPALLDALRATLPGGTQLCLYPTAALCEAARVGPLPEAESSLWSVLRVAQQEETPYVGTLHNALEVLYANHGSELLNELKDYLDRLPRNRQLEIAITEFISTKDNITEQWNRPE